MWCLELLVAISKTRNLYACLNWFWFVILFRYNFFHHLLGVIFLLFLFLLISSKKLLFPWQNISVYKYSNFDGFWLYKSISIVFLAALLISRYFSVVCFSPFVFHLTSWSQYFEHFQRQSQNQPTEIRPINAKWCRVFIMIHCFMYTMFLMLHLGCCWYCITLRGLLTTIETLLKLKCL